MTKLPKAILETLSPFKCLFSQQRTWHKAQKMLRGALLCRGKRTVSHVLEILGLSQEQHYVNYYRLLNRVKRSGLSGAKILLQTMMSLLLANQAIVIGVNETLERPWGNHIWGRGVYRDSVQSSHSHKTKTSGVRWQVMQLVSLITLES